MTRLGVALAAAAGLVAIAAALWWTWPEEQSPNSDERTLLGDAHAAPQSAPSAAKPANLASTNTAAEAPAADNVSSTLDDARHYCSDLLLGIAPNWRDIYAGRDVGPPECMAALDGMFLHESTGRVIVPLSRPMTWEDLFDDVRGDVEAVLAALRKEECVALPDDLRADLADDCAARRMAEVGRLRSVCGRVFPSAPSQDWRHETVAPFFSEESYVVVFENFSNYRNWPTSASRPNAWPRTSGQTGTTPVLDPSAALP